MFCIRSLILGFLALVCLACSQKTVAGFPQGEVDIANRFVDTWHARRTLELHEEFYRAENARLTSTSINPSVISGWRQLPSEIQTEFRQVVTENVKNVNPKLQRIAKEDRKKVDSLLIDWEKIRSQRDETQINLTETIANRKSVVKIASLLGVDNRWFWLFALVAFLALAVIASHNHRHAFRRQLNGGRAKQLGMAKLLRWAVVFFAIITLAVFVWGDRIYAAMVSRANSDDVSSVLDLQKELDSEKQKLEAAQLKHDSQLELWQKNVKQWASAAAPGMSDHWTQLRVVLSDVFVQSQIKGELATNLNDDNILLKSLTDQRNEFRGEISNFQLMRQILRTGLGAGLTLLVGVFAFVLLSRFAINDRRLADTCPQCAGIGNFQKSDHKKGSLVCMNHFEADGQMVECGFEIPGIYLRLPKLCFPTLGIPDTGKTHWLAMCFRELTLGNYPGNGKIQFEMVKAEGTDEIAEIATLILKEHRNPIATDVYADELRNPVVFNFSDCDPLGKSNLLANVFDYGGEITQNDNHPLRSRALDADGYFFFVDPTKGADEQAEALQLFRQDVRQLKRVTAGSALHVPVALCISKIDLLHLSENPIGEQAISSFYQDLGEIDISTPPMSLQNIEAKSELMQEMRELIWPNWQIENEINALFGGRVKFFPMTPVGVEDGKHLDFQDRVIEPYHVVEPLMWLLHMNGYQVLDR